MNTIQEQYVEEMRREGVRAPRPPADRSVIAHIGVGAFHRAHQAWYQERINRLQPDEAWSIIGIGLLARDRQLLEALSRQQGRYTLIMADQGAVETMTIGAIDRLITATSQQETAINVLSDPRTRIISMTVTEGGYLYDFENGVFQADHPSVAADLNEPENPTGLFGYLRLALKRRAQLEEAQVTLLSCDNIPGNGDVLRKALTAFLKLAGEDRLIDWMAENVSFPNSMVDRITPAVAPELRTQFETILPSDDHLPVLSETFSQWVMEDRFVAGRPDWAAVGATFTDDVVHYENLKIRLLNGSHVLMAQVGYRMGVRNIHELMEQKLVFKLVSAFMQHWAAETLGDMDKEEVVDYAQTILQRFSNPRTPDSVERVATDGFSRLKTFLVPIVRYHLQQRNVPFLLALPFACWLHKLRGQDQAGAKININEPWLDDDKRAEIVRNPGQWLQSDAMFGSDDEPETRLFLDAIKAQMQDLSVRPVQSVLEDLLADDRFTER